MQTVLYILPELFLSFSIMTLLMIGVFIKKSFKLVNLLSILSLIFLIILVLNQTNEEIKIFNDSYIIDRFSNKSNKKEFRLKNLPTFPIFFTKI